MNIKKARKLHHCKKCRNEIWPNSYYYPQRRGKALCLECKIKKQKPFLVKLLNRVGCNAC